MDQDSEKVKVQDIEISPMQNNGRSKYLLKRFSPRENPKETTQLNIQETKQEKLDINLRLSLGGIYNANFCGKPLIRSSSIIGVLTSKKDDEKLDSPLSNSFLSLSRSCSVPTEAEQEQRKAGLMALGRMRVESTQRFMGQSKKEVIEEQKSPDGEPMPSSPSKVAAWAAASAAKSPALCRALVQIKRQVALHGNRKLDGQEGSAAEKAGSCSKLLVMQKDAESKRTLKKISNGKPAENPSKRVKFVNSGFQDNGMDVMKQMPSVTTTGDGPNGKKIEGFLYKYTKGHVSIVCVCHGSFLTPAEFVKHAGGKDVQNPMKHITVCSNFSF